MENKGCCCLTPPPLPSGGLCGLLSPWPCFLTFNLGNFPPWQGNQNIKRTIRPEMPSSWCWWPAHDIGDLLMTLVTCSWHWWPAHDIGDQLMTLVICSWRWWPAHDVGDLLMTLVTCSWHWWPALTAWATTSTGGGKNLRLVDSWVAGREPLRVGGRTLISLLPVVGRLPTGVLPDLDANLIDGRSKNHC